MTVIPISKAVVREVVIHRKSRYRNFEVSGIDVVYHVGFDSLFCRKCKVADNCPHSFAVRHSYAFRTPQHVAYDASLSTTPSKEKKR